MSAGRLTHEADAQRIAWIAGSTHTILVGAAESEGRLTLLKSTFQQGAASPVHVHDLDDETFHLLAGTCTIWVGHDRWDLRSGDTAFLPRGVPHSYLITAPDTVILTVCNPGGVERFFQRAGWDLCRPVPEGWSVDLSGLEAASEGLGQHVLGPPLLDPGDVLPAGLVG